MKIMNRFKNSKGFTLIEIIFAIFIGLMMLSAIYVSMISGQRSAVAIDQKVAAQQDVRSALEMMAMEIGMASYNPTFASGLWRDPANCGMPGNQGYKGIQAANPNSITVEMDIGGTGVVNDESNETLTYAYDPASRRVTRVSNCGTPQSFIGDFSSAQKSLTVANDLLGINNGKGNGFPAIFRYYDGRGVELYPQDTPSDISNIRRVDITLRVHTNEVNPNTNQPRSMIYSTSVIVRNHSINF